MLHICNRKPYVVEEGFGTEQVRNNMLNGNLGCVPVVNPSRRIVRLLFWKEMFHGGVASKQKRRLNLPVVIMAGGQGTRLEPFTSVLPKPLIPVGDRTVIEIIIDQFLPYGLDRFHLSVNYKSKILKSFFEELAPSYSVVYLEEEEPRGTAGSLRALYSSTPENLIVDQLRHRDPGGLCRAGVVSYGQSLRPNPRRVAQGLSASRTECANWKRAAASPASRKSRNTAFS